MHPVLRLESLGALRLSGPEGELLSRRHKELALLVLLAHHAPRAMRREELQMLLWGDRPPERARHSLRQALLQLRRACGEAIEVGADRIAVREDVLFYDVRAFVDAVNESRFADAVACAAGDFLIDCDDIGSSDFRLWLDLERARLQRLLQECFERGSVQLEATGTLEAQLEWSRLWSERFYFDERAQLHRIRVLCDAGKPGEAEAVRTGFVRRLAQELEDEPAESWIESVEQMLANAKRVEATVATMARTASVAAVERPAPVHGNEPVQSAAGAHSMATPSAERRSRRGKLQFLVPAAAAAVALALIGWRLGSGSSRITPPAIAVGRIEQVGVPDSAAAVPQLLAISLGRARELRVISETRIPAVLAQLRSSGAVRADEHRAARVAGADELIEGVLARRADRSWQLDLRRIDLDTYATIGSYRIVSTDLLDAVDQATQRIARDLGAVLPAERFAGATASIGAYRLYQEGLRAYHDGDMISARRLFRSALAEDSTFAMAAHYAARASGLPDANALHEQAARMAKRASDHDRLFIMASWLAHLNAPARLAVAETLAIRYAAVPDAHYEYGRALVSAGRFLEAVRHFRQVVAMDSLGLQSVQPRCHACDAYVGAVYAYRYADSLQAAERLANEWVARQPGSLQAMLLLANVHASRSRYADALQVLRSAQKLDVNNASAFDAQPDVWLRMGDFDKTDRFWRGMLETGDVRRQMEALDLGISSLRMQGRFREALVLALRQRNLAQANYEKPIHEAYRHATVLFELGQFRAAAALFDSIAAVPFADSPSRNGRQRAWMLTQAAAAYAAAGDTAHLRELEGVIRTEGNKSAYRRDQLLHHYVRGLRLRVQGNPAAAAVEFRNSLYSPVEGNTRASMEYARSLLQLDRVTEAIPVLQSALAGPIGASGQYANRAELEELLAHAYDRAGQPALALPHYRWLSSAWKDADSQLHARRAGIEKRLN